MNNFFLVDLIRKLNLPTLIVTNSKTGIVNHTLLTIDACNRMEIPVSGFIINQITREGYTLESLTAQIENLTSKSVLATVSHVDNFSYDKYFDKFKQNTSLTKLGFKDS